MKHMAQTTPEDEAAVEEAEVVEVVAATTMARGK
jgi:hypothetical protein